MNKKLLALLGVYVSGIIATLLYNKKSYSEIKNEFEEADKIGEKKFKVLFNNFIEIHKNILEDFKVKILTEENKKLFYLKKDEFLALMKDYTEKTKNIYEKYENLGKNYIHKGFNELEKISIEYYNKIKELNKNLPDNINDTKLKLSKYFNEFKSKLKK